MSPVSSSVVFHFTNRFEHLLDILTSEFRPHYCVEDLTPLRSQNGHPDIILGVPMVSFCDIPLSQARQHIDTYGRYAIGLGKPWALRAGLTPVLYAHSNALTARTLLALAGRAATTGVSQVDALQGALKMLLFLSKPYEGRLWRGGIWHPDICFYNEREWRFLPGEPWRDFVVLDGPEALDELKRQVANGRVAANRIAFTPSDIRYVVVSKESEILPMVEHLRETKGKRYDKQDVAIVCSRVLTTEQIENDF